MRIVGVADTHLFHDDLTVPDGDVFIHAGDLCRGGDLAELAIAAAWIRSLPHRIKIVVAGNHDWAFVHHPQRARALLGADIVYLEDSGITIDGVRFWGSPWQPRFFDWAFNLDRGAPLKAKWDLIPAGTSVLVTHGPPFGILDMTARGEAVGCEELLAAVARLKPRVHIFGHIHEAHGERRDEHTRYVNAANCDLRYRAVQPPIVVEL